MAIPLQQDEQIFGVLDLQRRLDKPFTEGDLALMQGVANQLSVAINNLRMVDETRQALDRVETLNRRLIQGRWEATLKNKVVLGYAYSPLEVKPVDDEWLDGMIRLLAMGTQMEHGVVSADDSAQAVDELAIPVKLRGEIIGVLGMSREADRAWTQDELTIAHSIAGQIGLALENARLFEETSRRAGREKIIADITRRVWSSENLENVMQTAVAQLGEVLTASKVIIQLGTEAQLMTIPAGEIRPPVNGAG
jgi:GAF domain-containing protein